LSGFAQLGLSPDIFKVIRIVNRRNPGGNAGFIFEFVYVNRRKLFNNRKNNNRRLTQGFAAYNLGFVKLFTAKTPKYLWRFTYYNHRHQKRAINALDSPGKSIIQFGDNQTAGYSLNDGLSVFKFSMAQRPDR
jgi:hypothetical protein